MTNMRYEAIDHVVLAVPHLGSAVAPYEGLGLHVGPPSCPLDSSLVQRSLAVGGPADLFEVQFVAADPQGLPVSPLAVRLAAACASPGLAVIGLRVPDLAAALKELAGKGVQPRSQAAWHVESRKVAEVALLSEEERAGANLLLVQHAEATKKRHAGLERAGLLRHAFPLKRLDHLAVVTRDLEAQTRFWTDVLGVPVAGVVTTPTLMIRQLRIGDAVLELLAPASPDSPLRQRPPGPVSLASWEVADLAAAVEAARLAGLQVSDPAAGALPRTRTAAVPADEMGGLTMQLLQYVG
jgi:catechol 2,3-dioxygenase-like lactoylglutathione lyase family enzyme